MSVEKKHSYEASQHIKRNETADIVSIDTTAAPVKDVAAPISAEVNVKEICDLSAIAATATGRQMTRRLVKAEPSAANRATCCRVNGDELQRETNNAQEEAHHQLSYNRPQKYCAVCGDKAIACNFNAVTCESCKAFFRRNAFKEQRLRCLFEGRCVIDRVTRRFCSKCRLLKCLTIGMKREWILTDEQKQVKRVKIMQNKQARNKQLQAHTPVGSESGSDAAISTSTRSRRLSSITSSLGSDQNVAQINGNATCKERPLETSDDVTMIETEGELPKARLGTTARLVERRDAATDCHDLIGFELATRGGHMLPFCTFAHQCHFCSLRLATETTTTTPACKQSAHPLDHPHLQSPPHQHQQQHQQQQQVLLLPSQSHSAPASYSAPPRATDGAAYHPCPLMPHECAHPARHTPSFYSPPPVIVHPRGAAPHATLAPLQYQAGQVSVASSSHANCCLNSLAWMQHRNSGTCQLTTRCPEASARCLHPLEPAASTPQTGDDFRQQVAPHVAAACNRECREQSLTSDRSHAGPFCGESKVGVVTVDTPTQQSPVEPARLVEENAPADDEEENGDSEEEEEEEVENDDDDGDEEENRVGSSKEATNSQLTSLGERQQVLDEMGKIVSHKVAEMSETRANNMDQQHQQQQQQLKLELEHEEWRGETYCAPAASQSEILARVERLGFSDTERQLIQEMIEATRLVFEPNERMINDSFHDDLVFFCDAALRRLIKTVKQITSFRVLNMDDQIVLLKNACFKILLLRSSFHYVDEIEGWHDKSGCVLALSKLKTEKCRNYEKHKAIMDKLAVPLRRDRLLMAFMILIILFDPTVSLKHANSVQLDNMLYLYTLRKYLMGTQPEPLAKYERIVETLDVINACNEEYNLFFSRNYQPEEITPLLVEIFDISTNDIPM